MPIASNLREVYAKRALEEAIGIDYRQALTNKQWGYRIFQAYQDADPFILPVIRM